jgi:hypothetical protein
MHLHVASAILEVPPTESVRAGGRDSGRGSADWGRARLEF